METLKIGTGARIDTNNWEKLRRYAFEVAFLKTKDRERSEDLAQDAVLYIFNARSCDPKNRRERTWKFVHTSVGAGDGREKELEAWRMSILKSGDYTPKLSEFVIAINRYLEAGLVETKKAAWALMWVTQNLSLDRIAGLYGVSEFTVFTGIRQAADIIRKRTR